MVVCDKVVEVAEKAKAANSYEAVEDEWKAVSEELDALSGEAATWSTKYANGELTDADKKYYNKVLLPAGSKALSAASDMLDLIQL